MINVQDNRITTIPKEVLENIYDVDAILAAFASASRRNGVPHAALNEVKLLVVGCEAVGKSTLIKYIIDGEPRNDDEPRTQGIEIRPWLADSGLRLNTWDFAGQEIRKGLHGFFLSQRAMYLLVVDAQKEDDLEQFYVWLQTIEQRAVNVPVLVVMNKSLEEGVTSLKLDEAKLRDQDQRVVDFVRTSCNGDQASRASIAVLKRRVLEIVENDPRMQEVFQKVPPYWLAVRDRVRALAEEKNVLAYAEYENLCLEVGKTHLVDGQNLLEDHNLRRALMRTLDAMGVIVAYGLDDRAPAVTRDISLLDPNWLTRAVYRLITEQCDPSRPGVFTRRWMEQILDSAEYPLHHHEFILHMMKEELGLCFKLPNGCTDDSEAYLVPTMLSEHAIATETLIGGDSSLCLRYRYTMLPKGLVPKLIYNTHTFQEDPHLMWRSGVVLKISGHRVVFSASLEDKTVDIRVVGAPSSMRRDALAQAVGLLDQANAMFPESRPTIKLVTDQGEEEPYESLRRQEQGFGPEHGCITEAGRETTVGEILNGYPDLSKKRGVRRGDESERGDQYQFGDHARVVIQKDVGVDASARLESAKDFKTSEAIPKPLPSPGWSWLVVAGFCGFAAVLAVGVIWAMPTLPSKLWSAAALVAGGLVFWMVNQKNPAYRHWRLLRTAVIGGLVIHAAAFVLTIYGRWGDLEVLVNSISEYSPWFSGVWGLVIVVLGVLSWQEMKQHET